MEFTRFDQIVWERFRGHSLPSLELLVDLAHGKPSQSLTVETVIASEVHPFEALYLPGEERQFGTRAAMRVFDPKDGDFLLLAEPTSHEGIFHLVGSIPTSDRRWKRIERRILSAGARLTPCFLNHDDFSAFGSVLSEYGTVETRSMSARNVKDAKSINLNWQKTENRWRPSPVEAIAEAERDGYSVRSLLLHVEDQINVHIRRMSGATFYSGEFPTFERIVMARLADAAARRRDLMKDRQRQLDQPPKAPIELVLPTAVFNNAEDTGMLIREIGSSTSLGHAVLHRNPYLHLAVVDYRDGSNFDVFVTRADSIEVYPGFRASAGALTRLAQQLSERFAAETIRERPEPEAVSMYSLLAE